MQSPLNLITVALLDVYVIQQRNFVTLTIIMLSSNYCRWFNQNSQGPVPQRSIKLTLDWWKILIAISLPRKKGFHKIVAQKDYKLQITFP